MNFEIEARAAAFAAEAYSHQLRKYTGEPYLVHPCAVAQLVRSVPHTAAMLAAAWLHDVLEDCPHVSWRDIRDEFGEDVFVLVNWITDSSSPNDGNRATRKAKDRASLAAAPPAAQTIKLADLIHNTSSIVKYDREFARTYLPEKAELLAVLVNGDYTLFRQAKVALLSAWSDVFTYPTDPRPLSLRHPSEMLVLTEPPR